jgi:hypothetical protein
VQPSSFNGAAGESLLVRGKVYLHGSGIRQTGPPRNAFVVVGKSGTSTSPISQRGL